MDADKPDFQVLNVIDFNVLDTLPKALPFDQPVVIEEPRIPIQYIKREPVQQPRRLFRLRRR